MLARQDAEGREARGATAANKRMIVDVWREKRCAREKVQGRIYMLRIHKQLQFLEKSF